MHCQSAGLLTVDKSGPLLASSCGRRGRSPHAADHPGNRGRGGSGCFPLGSEPSAADGVYMGTDKEERGFRMEQQHGE